MKKSVLLDVKPEDYELKHFEQIAKGDVFTNVTYLINSYAIPKKEEYKVLEFCLKQTFKDYDIEDVSVKRKDGKYEVILSFKAEGTFHGNEISGDYWTPPDWEDELVFVEGRVYAESVEEFNQRYGEFTRMIFNIIPSDSIEVTRVDIDYEADKMEWDYTEEMKRLGEAEEKYLESLEDDRR